MTLDHWYQFSHEQSRGVYDIYYAKTWVADLDFCRYGVCGPVTSCFVIYWIEKDEYHNMKLDVGLVSSFCINLVPEHGDQNS